MVAEKQFDHVTVGCVCAEESDCWWSRRGPVVALLLTLWAQQPVAVLIGSSAELTIQFSGILHCQRII